MIDFPSGSSMISLTSGAAETAAKFRFFWPNRPDFCFSGFFASSGRVSSIVRLIVRREIARRMSVSRNEESKICHFLIDIYTSQLQQAIAQIATANSSNSLLT
ncbi:MAG: hypothetical protein WAM14_04875 [Candidatus Nitrosopolaris sp.]